jgi:mannose-6-phosphate isomerase-like protein (cupin superfamily)
MGIVDAGALADAVTERWIDIELARVDGSDVRLAVILGEAPFHTHPGAEFFFVLEGDVFIDMERDEVSETVTIGRHQGFVVPAGTRHRSRAPERAVLLMVEKAGSAPGGE